MNTANGIFPAHQNGLNPSLDQNGVHASYGQHFSAPTASPSNFDFTSQFPTQSSQRFDAINNNTSPSIHQSPFQVPSVVPQKRARDDHVGASPHPPQTSLGHSRSQTPQQAAYNQYATQAGGQNFATPAPFQHMQPSNHATPSPNPSNPQFRPPTSQPSMSSPHSFSGQHSQGQPFPQVLNPLNRMSTPQNGSNHMMPGIQPGQGLPPGAPMGMGPNGSQMPGQMAGMRPQMPANMSAQQQEMFKQYQQAMFMRNQQTRAQGQMPQGAQLNGMTPQQRAAAMAGAMNPNMPGKPGMLPAGDRNTSQQQAMQFMQQLQNFLHGQGQQLDPNPTVCGHPIHYFHLFQLFIRFKPLHAPQNWPAVMQQLRIAPAQHGQAMQELRVLYERNLMAFGRHYANMLEKQKQTQQSRLPGQSSPVSDKGSRPFIPPGFPAHHMQAKPPQASSPAMSERARAASSAAPDGIDRSTPGKPPSTTGHTSSPHQFPQGSPVPLKIGTQEDEDEDVKVDGLDRKQSAGMTGSTRTLFDPEYKPREYDFETHGGLRLNVVAEQGGLIHDYKTSQRWEELGPVDLQAMTLMLQSGIHQEISYALDQLAALSQRPLFLPECIDLVDTLLDIGRDQVQQLSEGVESTTELQISAVEDLTKASKDEGFDFREDRPFGGSAYAKRHAIDKLLAITTLFRNLSFPFSERAEAQNEENRKVLTSSDMQSFYARAIRLLNMSNSPLESNGDHLDIAKDVVVFLSNISETLVISNEDDARDFLVFLLAYAPKLESAYPPGKLRFASYEPLRHQNLPNALDSLAKILARDEPNRGLIKTILHNDLAAARSGSQSLLTKAFALAIAPLPDKSLNNSGSSWTLRMVDKRKPFITQGMLVLDILSTLIPAPTVIPDSQDEKAEPSLQRQWLESDDAWASRIIHLVIAMGMSDASNHHIERHPVTHEPVSSGHGFTSISQRALSMIKRLLEAADKADIEAGTPQADLVSARILGALPLDDMTFAAIMMPKFDAEVIRLLNALGQMVSPLK